MDANKRYVGEEKAAELEALFRLYASSEGIIPAAELGMLLRAAGLCPSNSQVDAIVKRFESSGKKGASKVEFIELYRDENLPTFTNDDMLQAFNAFDVDRSGSISKAELMNALTTMGEPISQSEVDGMFNRVHLDAHGELDYEAFCLLMSGDVYDGEGSALTKRVSSKLLRAPIRGNLAATFRDDQRGSPTDAEVQQMATVLVSYFRDAGPVTDPPKFADLLRFDEGQLDTVGAALLEAYGEAEAPTSGTRQLLFVGEYPESVTQGQPFTLLEQGQTVVTLESVETKKIPTTERGVWLFLPRGLRTTPPYLLSGSTTLTHFATHSLNRVRSIEACFLAACPALASVSLGALDGVEHIGDGFLCGSAKVPRVAVAGGQTVRSIGNCFLEKCHGVAQLDLDSMQRVQKIGDSFLAECVALREFVPQLPAVETLGAYFLFNALNLRRLDLACFSNLAGIPDAFLAGCVNLQDVNLLSLTKVTAIGANFLLGCAMLETLDLSALTQCKTIGAAFLSGCRRLKALDTTQMVNVERVDGKAYLKGCHSLTNRPSFPVEQP